MGILLDVSGTKSILNGANCAHFCWCLPLQWYACVKRNEAIFSRGFIDCFSVIVIIKTILNKILM